jgi:hypothetical protein
MPVWSFWGARESSPSPLDPRDNLEPPKHALTSEQIQQKAQQRITFNRQGAEAFAWPSEGGILVKPVNAVDLQHLEVSRAEPTPRSKPFDTSKEDEWCAKLRQLAPQWFRSRKDRDLAIVDGRLKTRREIESVYVAWPTDGTSGVWILKFVDGRASDGFGVYDMCINMTERCQVLKQFGAIYHKNPHECFELSQAYSDECRKQRDEIRFDSY